MAGDCQQALPPRSHEGAVPHALGSPRCRGLVSRVGKANVCWSRAGVIEFTAAQRGLYGLQTRRTPVTDVFSRAFVLW